MHRVPSLFTCAAIALTLGACGSDEPKAEQKCSGDTCTIELAGADSKIQLEKGFQVTLVSASGSAGKFKLNSSPFELKTGKSIILKTGRLALTEVEGDDAVKLTLSKGIVVVNPNSNKSTP